MADLNAIRTQLLDIIHPPTQAGESLQWLDLFEAWAGWNTNDEVDVVCQTLEEAGETRFVRLLIQYLGAIGTPRALFHLSRLAGEQHQGLVGDCLSQLEKIKTRTAQLLLLHLAETESTMREVALSALERSATREATDDFQLKLSTTKDPALQIALLLILRKIQATDAVPLIIDIAQSNLDPMVLTQALFSLAHLGQAVHLSHFTRYLASTAAPVRRAAIFGLQKLGGVRGLELLVRHLETEPERDLQKEILVFLARMEAQPPMEAVERLAAWAAHAESPAQRALAQSLLTRWMDRGAGDHGRKALRRMLRADPLVTSVLLHAMAEAAVLNAEELLSIVTSHSQTLVRVSALESLSLITKTPPADMAYLESDIDFGLRYAETLWRTRPANSSTKNQDIPESLLSDSDNSPVLQAALYQCSLTKNEALSDALYARLESAAKSGSLSTRFLAVRVLAATPRLRAVALCRQAASEDPDRTVVLAALEGILNYLASPDSDIGEAIHGIVGNPHIALHLRHLVRDADHFPPMKRKAIGLRLSRYLSTLPALQIRPLRREGLEWLVVFRLLMMDFERDLMAWMQTGSIPQSGLVPALVTLRALLHHETRRMDFAWLSSLMDSPDRWIRNHTARLLVKHAPWTPAQTMQLMQWYVREPESNIRETLHRQIQNDMMGFAAERRSGVAL